MSMCGGGQIDLFAGLFGLQVPEGLVTIAEPESVEPHTRFEVATTPEIEAMLARNAVVAIGVSGGKDSNATALATAEYLARIGHKGPKVLIHADLGRIEWRDSGPNCERLAARLGWPLMVVRRTKGDMIDRWVERWANNVNRYARLGCVSLISPWSSSQWRFCTSEMKMAVIGQALTSKYKRSEIISVTGIRRCESDGRKDTPICASNTLLQRKKKGTTGVNWNNIALWGLDEVFEYLELRGMPLHQAYTEYGTSRVSCCYCVLGSQPDLRKATKVSETHEVYRTLTGLELVSTFSFQGGYWLADKAPHLLDSDALAILPGRKQAGELRLAAEQRIPEHLKYVKGWPTCVPSLEDAALLAEVRREVSGLVGIKSLYTTAGEVRDRYDELMKLKATKDSRPNWRK
jgi:3'-phosphoadenosine 5'-phosphosulfate sulfotransferase (PAPS reductase)/FAD synthetase